MTKKEYLDTLIEQIGNRHAKQLVAQEYEDHIEDQKEAYMEAGMEESEAEQQAVRQMGNPIEAGARLNQIHRPKFPTGLFVIVLMLTGIGIVMQSIGFAAQENSYVNHHYLGNTILYNIVGLLIMVAILFFDYNYLVKYAYVIYSAYVILFAGLGIGAYIISGGIDYASGHVCNYFFLLLYPMILAGIIYRNKGRGMKGLLSCIGLSLLPLALEFYIWQSAFSGGVVEYLIVTFAILLFAVWKKVFGKKRKGMFTLLLVPAVILLASPCVIVTTNPGNVLAEYQLVRLRFLLGMVKNPEEYAASAGYIVMQLRSVMGNLSLWGDHALPANIPTGDMYSTFIVTGIFSWFGIVVGCIVVGLLFFFCFRALQLSIRQKNRMGMLIGMACTASILLRSLVCVAINFGFGLYYTSSVPFLSYGKLATIVNALYVGLILCVCRNEAVMPEKQPEQLRRQKKESSHECSV